MWAKRKGITQTAGKMGHVGFFTPDKHTLIEVHIHFWGEGNYELTLRANQETIHFAEEFGIRFL